MSWGFSYYWKIHVGVLKGRSSCELYLVMNTSIVFYYYNKTKVHKRYDLVSIYIYIYL